MTERLAIAAICLVASAACGTRDSAAGSDPSSSLVLLDSVTLEESEAAYLGAPLHVSAGRDGSLFVSDGLRNQVTQFSRRGDFVRAFGRPGQGPGELADPLATTLVGDSLLVVAEWGNRRTSVFDVKTGAFRRAVPHEGLPFWMEARDDTVWISNVNIVRKTSLSAWPTAQGSMRYFGEVPKEYHDSPALMEFHPYATVALVADTLVFGFSGHRALFRATMDGAVFDTVEIPAVRRRGVPRDIVARFAKDPRGISNEEVASMASSLMALRALSSGEIAMVHLDVRLEGRQITADGFVSILSRDLTRACVDIPLALSKDGRPAVGFRGDTLVVVEQRIVSSERAVSYARSYRLDPSGCEWVPVGPAPRR
jgi:hypothetical protein